MAMLLIIAFLFTIRRSLSCSFAGILSLPNAAHPFKCNFLAAAFVDLPSVPAGPLTKTQQ
jgi:hypothetical protein